MELRRPHEKGCLVLTPVSDTIRHPRVPVSLDIRTSAFVMLSWTTRFSIAPGVAPSPAGSFAPGETYYSALVAEGAEVTRHDYAADAWQGPPAEAIGWWKSQIPNRTEGKKRWPRTT